MKALFNKIYAFLLLYLNKFIQRRKKFAKWVKSKTFTQRLLIRFAEAFIFFILFLIIVDLNILWLFGRSPNISEINTPKYEITSELYSADGILLAKYFNKNRNPVKYNEITPTLINTLIAVEDNRFYNHNGIDLKAAGAVLWYAIRGERRGGSTITQQLVKNLFRTRDNYSRGLFGSIPVINVIIYKTKEWINALKIEWYYSKKEILAMYLNTVDFGSNTYGINTAAKTFFNTSPLNLNEKQCATLIGLLKAPTYYSPIKNPERCKERRNLVFRLMRKHEIISISELEKLKEEPLSLSLNFEENYNGRALYFRGAVAKFLKPWLEENNLDLYRDGLKIYTTIDSRLQIYAEEAVKEQLMRLQRSFNNIWKDENPWTSDDNKELTSFLDGILKQTTHYKYLKEKYKYDSDSINILLHEPHKIRIFTWNGERDTLFSTIDSLKYYLRFLHAGFVSMDPNSGEVKTWVGGIDYKYFKYDHVKQSKRQPGSSFKTFIYATAIDNGWGPCDKLTDKPVTIKYIENNEEKSWSPQNVSWKFTGMEMTLKHAFARSVNSIAVQLTEQLGWGKVIEYAHKMGIKSELTNVPSVCLGTSDVSLYELLNAYCPIVNGGYHVEPIMVTRIEDCEGNVLKRFDIEKKEVFSQETAFLTLQLLLGGMTEPGATTQALWAWDLFRSKIQFGGKTGTSQNLSDGWFVGITPNLVGAAWVGGQYRSIHFKNNNQGEGCKTALPIFGIFMEKVLHDPEFDYLKVSFTKPDIKITKPYSCQTYLPKIDTSIVDSAYMIPQEEF